MSTTKDAGFTLTPVSAALVTAIDGLPVKPGCYVSFKQGSMKRFVSFPFSKASTLEVANFATAINSLTNMTLQSITVPVYTNSQTAPANDDPPGKYPSHTLAYKCTNGANPLEVMVVRITIPEYNPVGKTSLQIESAENLIATTLRPYGTDTIVTKIG